MRVSGSRSLRALWCAVMLGASALLALVGCASSDQGLDGWTEETVPGVGTIMVPDTMEVQSKEYRALKEEVSGISSDSFIVQQYGLNDDLNSAYDTYVRVMINCDQGSSGDYPPEEFDPDLYTESEIDGLSDELERQMRAQFEGTALEIVDWYPLELTCVNDMPCMHIAYSRMGDEGETTKVDYYVIPADDRLVRVSMSYRESDAGMWKDDLEQMLETLEIG